MIPKRVLGIAGGSGAGKSTLTRRLVAALGPSLVTVLRLDDYYLGPPEHSQPDQWNYDHPDSLDTALFTQHLVSLRNGSPVQVPVYDFATHSRSSETRRLNPRDIIITEGILLLHIPEVLELIDISVFVDAPESLRFERRLARDMKERGRTRESVYRQFNQTVKPMHDLFVNPSRENASMCYDGSEENAPLFEALVKKIRLLSLR